MLGLSKGSFSAAMLPCRRLVEFGESAGQRVDTALVQRVANKESTEDRVGHQQQIGRLWH